MKKAFAAALAAFFLTAISVIPVSAQTGGNGRTEARDFMIKCEVETALSLLQAVYALHLKGEMTLDKAKELGAGLLRELRYAGDGYFWADTIGGVNVVLHGQKDTEGRNRLGDKDAKGFAYVKAFLEKGGAGGGYVEYFFTKLGDSGHYPKRSYVKLFEPFGWVIGTGYYLE